MFGAVDFDILHPPANQESPAHAFHDEKSLAMASDHLVQQAIGLYLGFNRRSPPAMIHADTAKKLYRLTRMHSPSAVVVIYKSQPADKRRRVLLRAVHYNVWRMRRAMGGKLSWEA